MSELKYVSAGGIIHSNGFPEESLDRAMESDPDFIGVDAGSVDGGPYYLGSGENMHSSRTAAKEVYRLLLTRARQADIPLLIGSAATGGRNDQIDWTVDIFHELAEEEGLEFNLAKIYCEQKMDYVRDKIENGRVNPLDKAADVTPEELSNTDSLVAMMGPEPFINALDSGADVVVGGRSSDVAILKAIPLRDGFHEGLATHLAKILECGALPARDRDEATSRENEYTGSGDCMLGTITDDSFLVKPTNPDKIVDTVGIASHLLYETADPYNLIEPRGALQTKDSSYAQVDEQTVEVRGSTFDRREPYTVKLEGVKICGYRAGSVFGVRDPLVIENIDVLKAKAEAAMGKRARERDISEDTFGVSFNTYGVNGVMKEREPYDETSHELGVFVTVTAPDRDIAHDLLEEVIYCFLSGDFPGRKCTAGNVAFPTSPSHMDIGVGYEFTVWHSMEIDDPLEPFEIDVVTVGESR